MGGGERYVHELARFMGREVPTVVISFGDRRFTRQEDGYRLEVFPSETRYGFSTQNPWSIRFVATLSEASVIHVHQISTMIGDMACLLGKLRRIPVFVTDHGGGGGRVLHTRLPIQRLYTAAIAQSRYAERFLARRPQKRVVTIPGGIDLEYYQPTNSEPAERRTILFVGRLLPHKGVHLLVKTMETLREQGMELKVVGRVYDQGYYKSLRSSAESLPVSFHHDLDDGEVRGLMQSSLVTVLPSVQPPEGSSGDSPVSELMGFTPLESQACGTPVIVSDAGAMAEFVENGKSGFVVPQNNVPALVEAVCKIAETGDSMRAKTRSVVERYSWTAVTKRHLELYQSAINASPHDGRNASRFGQG